MKRGLVDVSNIIWTALQAGEDKEFGRKVLFEEKLVKINSAQYGYEIAMRSMRKAMADLDLVPHQLILVPEGSNSKQDRSVMHPGYKSGRSKAPEQYVEFHLAKEMLLKTFLSAGALQAWQDGGVEADDVLGYLAQNLEGERWIISGDKDLAAAVGGDVHHYRAGKIDENPFGDFPHKFIPVCIALVGDSGDKIPGARGFGASAFQDLVWAFGVDGLELMEGLIKTKNLLSLEEDVGALKSLQKIIDDAENVYLSYELGRLRSDKVNSVRRPLKWKVGMVKPREQCEDETMRVHMGVAKIVCAENYAAAVEWARKHIETSPYVTLDVETSTPEASDEWLATAGKDKKVDVFGSELTSLQMTFGPNLQYSVYLPLDNVPEPGVSNLTIDQIVDFVDMVPRHKISYVHNAAFELPVCFMAWAGRWSEDPEYHGFLRNVRDTRIGSNYVDENRSAGLKGLSKDLLEYEQTPYLTVVTKDYDRVKWNGKGKVLQTYSEPQLPTVEGAEPPPDIERVVVEHKMNQLTARQVLGYGCDDTICTAAIANYFRCAMEIEKTWGVYEEVETYPAYLHALAFVQGTPFSLEHMSSMEHDDDAAYAEAEPHLYDYLMKIGFDGTVCPVFTEMVPAQIKQAITLLTGLENPFKVRVLDKVSKVLDQWAAELLEQDEEKFEVAASRIRLLSAFVLNDDLAGMNDLVARNFEGKPTLDLASPTQMTRLLYDHMKLPVRVINKVTPIERQKKPELNDAVRKFSAIRAGRSSLSMTDSELELVRKKASSDDTAINMALAFDSEDMDDDVRAALKAIGVMKTVMTRRSLYYNNYRHILHWKDRKIHASINQSVAVTRRGSSSDPNLQQLPKKGEGVRFRGGFKPHKKNAVIASIDYVGQELRLAAWRSQDKNMLACYVGEFLKDIHSMTAAGAMPLKWGKARVEELFGKYGADLPRDGEGPYELFLRLRDVGKADPVGKEADDLRKDSKNVNFGAQNLAQAVRLAETLIMTVEDAQLFLDARAIMFPDVDRAAERAGSFARRHGYSLTMMGARRHLAHAFRSDEPGVADRAARQSWNYEIQGSAGEMTKMGETRLWKSGVYFKYDARFIAPIHDELVSSVTKEDAVDFLREKHACMAQPYADMKVPVLGSISIGADFAKQIECGDEFIETRIRAALASIFKEEVACSA